MKTLKVIDIDLYDRLMSLLKDQHGRGEPQTEKRSSEASIINANMDESAPQRLVTEVDTAACTCVMHSQHGDGIKRTLPENWLSFQDFVRKRKQQKITKKKKKCTKQRGRC